jgi:hypothetical protein
MVSASPFQTASQNSVTSSMSLRRILPSTALRPGREVRLLEAGTSRILRSYSTWSSRKAVEWSQVPARESRRRRRANHLRPTLGIFSGLPGRRRGR